MEKKFYTEPESMIVLLDKDDTIATSLSYPTLANSVWETGTDTSLVGFKATDLSDSETDVADISSFENSALSITPDWN